MAFATKEPKTAEELYRIVRQMPKEEQAKVLIWIIADAAGLPQPEW